MADEASDDEPTAQAESGDESTTEPEPDAEAEPDSIAVTGPAILTKADKLQAKADRLRERDAEKAARREAEETARAEARARVEAVARVAPPAPAAGAGGSGWIVATAVLSAVAGIAIVLLVIGFVMWSDKSDDLNRERALDNARTGAVAAAKSWAVDFGSYDYRHLDADFAKTTAVMTKSFAAEYKKTSTALAPTFTAYKTSVTASVPQAAAVSATTTKAVVLVLLDQVITSTQSSTPKINRNRLQVTLEYQGGRWLVAKTDAT